MAFPKSRQGALRALLPSARSLRMAAYSLFAFGVLGIAASRSVYADAREMGFEVGHQLAKLEDLTANASRVRVNGAELHRGSAHTQQTVAQVLDRFERYCRASPGTLGRAMADIPSALAGQLAMPNEDPLRASVVREEANGHGMVVCFVEDPTAPRRDVVEKLRDLGETSDLSKLGRFRYVFAEPSTSTQGGTHVVTSWCDGELNVGKMFPASGDAPGTDSALSIRPLDSRRVLSATVDGYPASVRVYESSATRDAIEHAFDDAMLAKRFRKVETSDRRGVAYLGGVDAEVVVSFTKGNRRTMVTVVESGSSKTAGVRLEVAR